MKQLQQHRAKLSSKPYKFNIQQGLKITPSPNSTLTDNYRLYRLKNPFLVHQVQLFRQFSKFSAFISHMRPLNLTHFTLIILILVLLNNPVNALTDLTRLNCPDNFDVTVANTTKPNDAFVKFFYSAFDSPEFKSAVDTIVIQGKSSQLSSLIMQLMTPYIAIVSVFFIFFMIVACCTMFEKSCPPCESWRRDFARRPYEKFELRCVMIFTIIFAVSIFILSIVMFTAFPVFKKQMAYTECSLYNMLDITKNGDQAKQWGGFSQLKNQVGNISSLLTTASSEVNKNFKGANGLSNDDWIIDNMEEMKKGNYDFYRNNKDSKLPSPNPNTPTALVNSSFIQSGLDPNGTDTMVKDLDTALRATQVLSQQAYLIEKQCQILVDSANTIAANTNSSQQALQMYQDQLDQIQTQLKTFSTDYFDQLTDWGMYVIEGMVGLILAGSIFILFGTVSTHILDIMACRSMVNLGWVIYAFTYFGIVALTFIFLSMGSVGYNFCNYFDQMVTNKAEFNRIGQAYSQNAFTKLDVCMYGDGNVLSKFNIAKQMSTVTEVFTNIQTYYDYQNPTSIKFIDKTKSVDKIQGWIDAMQKYRLGIYIDSNPSLTTDDNPLNALASYNKKTKYFYPNGTLNTNCPRDIWVFDEANCSDPNAEIFHSTTEESNGLRFTTLNDLCISFNQKLISTYSYKWDENDIRKRYQQIIHTCPDAFADIVRYGKSLTTFRNSRMDIFQGIKDSLISLKAKHVKFNSDLVSYKTRVDAFYSSVSTLNNLVTDKTSGLLVSSDCRIISDYLKVTNNVLCKNVMAQVSVMGTCCVLLLCVMIGGIVTASVFSVRYSRIETSQKHSKRIVIPQSSILSQTFEKKHRSESSSSSSSDED